MARAWAKLTCGALSSSSSIVTGSGNSFQASICTNEAYLTPGNSYNCEICFKVIASVGSEAAEECVSAGSVTIPKICACNTELRVTESGNTCNGWSEYFDLAQGIVELQGDDVNGYTADGVGVDASKYCDGCAFEGTSFDLCGCGNAPKTKEFSGSGGEPQYSDWKPDPSEVCLGEEVYQTRELLDSSCKCCDGITAGRCRATTSEEPIVGTKPREFSLWYPDPSTKCDGQVFEQVSWEVNGCAPDAHRNATGTGECPCSCEDWGYVEQGDSCGDGKRSGGNITVSGNLNGVDCPPIGCLECIDCTYPDESIASNWTPSLAGYYDCEEVDQTLEGDHPDCPPKLRVANGTKNPYLDEELDWSESTDTVCQGVWFQQTANHSVCGNLTQNIQGTMAPDWAPWTPGAEDICDGQSFTQSRHDLNACVSDENQQATGTSTAEDCSCNCEAFGSVEPGGQCPEGHRGGGNVTYTYSNSGCPPIDCMECIECTYSGPWSPDPSTECEGEFEQSQAGNHPDCPPKLRMAQGTMCCPDWGLWTGDDAADICLGSTGSRTRSDQNGCAPDETETVQGTKDCSSIAPAEAPIGEV